MKKLFPKNNCDNEFINTYINSKEEKIVGQRKEINIENTDGEEVPVIILLSEARLEDEITYTAFIQNISVDLF